MSPAPYADLTPDRLLDALATVGLIGDGRLLALNSYENRVYQVYVEDTAPLGTGPGAAVGAGLGATAGAVTGTGDSPGVVVAKFYRPGRWTDAQILEEHAFTAALEAAEIPVVAPARPTGLSLHHDGEHRFALFRRHGGRTPELDNRDTLRWIGRFIGRIHALGAAGRFVHRPALDVAELGEASRDWLLAHDCVPPELLPAWRAVTDQAIDAARETFARIRPQNIRLHGDCHPGNILWTDAGPHFVDFDDCRSGPAIQDLWMLVSGDRAEMAVQFGELLAAYRQFHDFDPAELGLIEALRTLRLIHYSAWIARRWTDPAFPAAFPWFGSARYWQDRILELREQLGAMQEPPLTPEPPG